MPSSRPLTMPTEPLRFMDLPLELRLQVYQELVVVGKIFYTPDRYTLRSYDRFKGHENYRKPSLAILRTSKAVHKEAEDVYLSQNLFVLPFIFQDSLPFAGKNARSQIVLFSTEALAKVKHVSIEVSSRTAGGPLTIDLYLWNDYEERSPGLCDRKTALERLNLAHSEAMNLYDHFHFEMVCHVRRLCDLQTLELDFTVAYYPVGCCRTLNLDEAWHDVQSMVKEVRILGLCHEREEKELMAAWSLTTEIPTEGLFMNHDIKYDPLSSSTPRVSSKQPCIAATDAVRIRGHASHVIENVVTSVHARYREELGMAVLLFYLRVFRYWISGRWVVVVE